MKQILFILSICVFSPSFGQVDNYDLLTKDVESSNIKSITKFEKSKRFPNGEKKFKLEFNKEGKLVLIEEYNYPMEPDNPFVMRQEINYDQEGRKVSTHIKAPDGSTAIDTFIYNNQNKLSEKQRLVNKQVVRAWSCLDVKEDDEQKEFDDDGNLIKLIESDSNYTTYKYDSNGNLTQELNYQDREEHTKYTFKYDKSGQLTGMETYLLYLGGETNVLLEYYFEYERFR